MFLSGLSQPISSQQNFLHTMLFLQFHISPIGSHNGKLKTRNTMCARYYWPGMTADIEKWVIITNYITIEIRLLPKPINVHDYKLFHALFFKGVIRCKIHFPSCLNANVCWKCVYTHIL